MNSTEKLSLALAHVRWIGGGSGAAKSTTARRLAEAYGAMVYDTDATMGDHASRCPEHICPKLTNFKRMGMDERWVHRSPEEMHQTFHWFAGEGFHLIIDDLLALPSDCLVIAEGFRLLPSLVSPLLRSNRHAVWLLPTPAFRRHAFDARDTTWDIPRKTSNAELALANLLARDELFTERVREEVNGLGLHALNVDGAKSEAALAEMIGDLLFG